MSTGGRILHHEIRYLPDKKNTFLVVCYQAQGTLGREIFDGAKSVTIFRKRVPVNCKVQAIGGYSSHADQPTLIKWLRPMKHSLKKVFIVHGDPEQSEILRKSLKSLNFRVRIPAKNETVFLAGKDG